MNDSAYKISLDINEYGSQLVLKAKQSDTGRKIYISLRSGSTPYTIADDCYAVFTAKKPDGKILYNACTIENNEIIYEFTEQTCSAIGRSRCEIKLYGLDDALITSPRFALLVDGTVYPDGSVESTDEFSALTQMVSDSMAAKAAANEAAENANNAAAKAAHTAKALMVIGGADGTDIHLDDAIKQYLVGLRIFGKTTQDGTPTPSSPVDLVNAGAGGSITVNVTGENEAQSMTITTPNGLPGIPVTSGGNYTDASGQMWYADEIDLARGVYIQRCYAETIMMAYEETNNRYIGETSKNANPEISEGIGIFVFTDKLTYNENAGTIGTQINGVRISYGNKKAVIAYYNGQIISSLDVLYPLETPIEVPLSEEELAAYAALYTYRNSTTVTNDAGAYMELEYVMDAKMYIDSLVEEAVARLENVTLLASAWVGADSLYSQVVTIEGITPYSKVDLLPSVEQLAIFHNKDVAFVTENEDGVVTVFAIGDKPTNDYTMQVSITEVSV